MVQSYPLGVEFVEIEGAGFGKFQAAPFSRFGERVPAWSHGPIIR